MSSGGILVRQSSGYLMIRANLISGTGTLITTGTATLRLFQLLTDGSLASMDFADKVFKSAGPWTTQSVTMNHQNGYSAYATALWTYRIAVADITNHANSTGIIFAHISHASSFPLSQVHEFMVGGADGDVTLDADKAVKAYVNSISSGALSYTIHCGSSYDHQVKNISFLVFTEQSGVLKKIKNATVQFYDSSNNLLGAASGTQDNAGKDFFYLALTEMTLNPDATYFIKTTVLHMDDSSQVSGSTAVTFD